MGNPVHLADGHDDLFPNLTTLCASSIHPTHASPPHPGDFQSDNKLEFVFWMGGWGLVA